MLFKMIILGLFKGKKAYFRTLWNIFDFIIVVILFIDTYFEGKSGFVASLKFIKFLNPLRTISHF